MCSIKALFPVLERSSVLPTFTLWPAAPLRFVACAVSAPSEAFNLPISSPSTVKTWSAIATQGDHTLFRRSENLPTLLTQLRDECIENWPDSRLPSQRIPMALMLDATELLERELHCQAHWRPDDIAAECWLEAANQLQVPVAQVLMDFEVRFTAQGHWVAKYVACLQNLVQPYQAQLNALNFQLDIFTSSSQSEALCASWGLQFETMAHAFSVPKLIKGSNLC